MRVRPLLTLAFGLVLATVAGLVLSNAAGAAWVDGANFGSEGADCGGVPIHSNPENAGQDANGPNCRESEDSWRWWAGAGVLSALAGATITLAAQGFLPKGKSAQPS